MNPRWLGLLPLVLLACTPWTVDILNKDSTLQVGDPPADADPDGPAVLAIYPNRLTPHVEVDQEIWIAFRGPMAQPPGDIATLTRLANPADPCDQGTPFSDWTFETDPLDDVAIIRPNSGWDIGATYCVSVATNLQSLSQLSLELDYGTRFTVTGSSDPTSPRILATSPNAGVDGFGLLSVGTRIDWSVRFSHPMEVWPLDGKASAVRLYKDVGQYTAVPNTEMRWLGPDQLLLSLAADEVLDLDATYVLVVNPSLTSRDGRNLGEGLSLTFRTRTSRDENPPFALGFWPDLDVQEIPRSAVPVVHFSEPISTGDVAASWQLYSRQAEMAGSPSELDIGVVDRWGDSYLFVPQDYLGPFQLYGMALTQGVRDASSVTTDGLPPFEFRVEQEPANQPTSIKMSSPRQQEPFVGVSPAVSLSAEQGLRPDSIARQWSISDGNWTAPLHVVGLLQPAQGHQVVGRIQGRLNQGASGGLIVSQDALGQNELPVSGGLSVNFTTIGEPHSRPAGSVVGASGPLLVQIGAALIPLAGDGPWLSPRTLAPGDTLSGSVIEAPMGQTCSIDTSDPSAVAISCS